MDETIRKMFYPKQNDCIYVNGKRNMEVGEYLDDTFWTFIKNVKIDGVWFSEFVYKEPQYENK